MDLCIKTIRRIFKGWRPISFNPCFNGSMYKNQLPSIQRLVTIDVSILVLMDLCIKTLDDDDRGHKNTEEFQSLF
mgnify:CR=1 FL=1